jgi:hypothetical protein
MNYYLFLAGAFGVGCGVAIAAALLTYRHASPPAAEATDAQRQDALERFKIWTEFWKYFLVSFALVLITTLLGQILKQRELDLQKSKQASELALQQTKQEGELALEKEKQTSKGLMDENTNLGAFLDKAMVDSADQQFRFASYFSHLVRDAEARKRWESYAAFIQEAKKAAPKLETEAKQVAAQLNNPQLPEAKRAELQMKSNDLQSKLDLNKALLEAPATRDKSAYSVGLQTVGVDANERVSINEKLQAEGYGLDPTTWSYPADQRPSWFAAQSTVFYYSSSSRPMAEQVARFLKRTTGQDFIVQRGAGLGVDSSRADLTLFVHYIKP